MIRAHTDAILARLREDTVLTDSTFEGLVTDRPERYCTVYPNSGFRESFLLSGVQTQATFSYTIHSVGLTPVQAQFVAERVFAQLLNWRPVITGRRCHRVRHEASQPVQVDRDTSPWLYYAVDVFDLTSIPG